MKEKNTSRRRTTRPKPVRRTAPLPSKPPDLAMLHDQIARRAHEIYERRIHQGPLDDWLQAEQEILALQKPGS